MGTHTFAQGPGRYVKLAAALFGAIASSVVALGITGGHINPAEWVNIGIAAVGALQVWYVSETSDNPNGKAVIAAVAAGLVALQSFVSGAGHINLAEWMQVGLAALTATGVWASPPVKPKVTYLAAPTENSVTKTYAEGIVQPPVKVDLKSHVGALDPTAQAQAGADYIQQRYGNVQQRHFDAQATGETTPPAGSPDPAPRPQDLP